MYRHDDPVQILGIIAQLQPNTSARLYGLAGGGLLVQYCAPRNRLFAILKYDFQLYAPTADSCCHNVHLPTDRNFLFVLKNCSADQE